MSTQAPELFDRRLYRARRSRAAASGTGDLFLAEAAAEQIAARLTAVNRRFERGLDLASRAGLFPNIAPSAQSWVRAGYAGDRPDVVADEEALPFADESFDLVTSILSLHVVNDLPGALVQIRRVLKPDGLFLGALFGGASLQELRHAFVAAESEFYGGAAPRVAPFADVRDLGQLLQRAGFALPVTDVERTTVRYRDLARLFSDLRALGETNVLRERARRFLSRHLLERVIEEYRARFNDGPEHVVATAEIVFLAGWAPHESQQKALKPGTAKQRLADALGTKEHKAGDVAAPGPVKS